MANQNESNIIEVYLPIVGFEKYDVSNHGNIRNRQTMRILKSRANRKNYMVIDLGDTMKQVHRLVAEAFLLNPENKKCIDHIDGDTINNKLINLRYATNQENSFNQKLSVHNTSGSKGVCYDKSKKKWKSSIKLNSKSIQLGYFERIEDAIQARQIKAYELFGEFCQSSEKITN